MANQGKRFVFDTADFIISGDGDLQVLNPFRKIKIISPREFLDTDI